MKVVVSHPTGNLNVRAVLMGLEKSQMLSGFYTTIATDPDAVWLKLFPAAIRNEFLRRTYPLLANQISTKPFLELLRMMLPKIGLRRFTSGEHAWAGIDAVYSSLDRKLAKNLPHLARRHQADTVYAYEDAALHTFSSAKKLGLKCVYDLPIAYWETGRNLMMEEAGRLPQWAITLGGGILDSPRKLERKTRELEMADLVIGPGKFVIDSLPAWSSEKKVVIAPFGSPVIKEKRYFDTADKTMNRPLRVLFAGSMSQRKGLGDLFAAMRMLNNPGIELIVMGSLQAPMEFYRREFPGFTYEPGRPNAEVLALMRSCDVFCLPSIVEGRALVMQEAMSQGLPLIITTNTGGEDLIIEGETGFLVPVRSPASIANKLCWFLENRSKIPEMGIMAQRHAEQYTWSNYGAGITNAIKKLQS